LKNESSENILKREEFEMKLRKLIHSVKALSPIFATLILIAIAVIAGVVVYMFTSGYIATMTGGGTAGQEKIAIQSVSADTTGTVTVLLQSISGNPVVQNIIVKDSSGNQVAVVTANAPNPAPNPGPGLSTGTLYSISGASTVGLTAGNSYTVTVVTRAGNNFVSPTFTTSTSTSGGATPTPTPSPSPTPTPTPTPAPMYYKPITFNGVTGTLTNFPVLVSISADTQIGARATSADQIYFTDDTGTNVLASEIESFSNTAGSASLTAWVKIPSLTSTSAIRIYYGSDNPNPQPATAAWNSNYKGVWHLDEDGNNNALGYADATSNANHGTGTSMTATSDVNGKVGIGQHFDGTADVITVVGSASLDYAAPLTVEAWVEYDNLNGGYSGWFMGKCTGDSDINWRMRGFGFNSAGRLWYNTASGDPTYVSTATTPANTWVHVAATIVSPNTLQLYVNGAPSGTWSISTGSVVGGTSPLSMGLGFPGEYFRGSIDEVRVSNMALSAQWIQTEYNNMNNPSGFITLGTQQTS
jgi:flagellin-like protein